MKSIGSDADVQIRQSFMDGLELANTLDEAFDCLLAAANDFGFNYCFLGMVAYPSNGLLDMSEVLSMSNLPSSYTEFYSDGNYVRFDETIQISQRTALPHRWEHIDHIIRKEESGVYESETRVLGETTWESGLKSGFTFPLGTGASSFVSSLGLSSTEMAARKQKQYPEKKVKQLQQLGDLFQARIFKLLDMRYYFRLTEKEIECLNSFALGCTDEESAQRTGLSKSRVRDYDELLKSKLKVKNRQQLISRAESYGLVGTNNINVDRFDMVLTPRQYDYLRWRAVGVEPIDIADKFNRAISTIRKEEGKIREKFGVTTIDKAFARAVSTGLID